MQTYTNKPGKQCQGNVWWQTSKKFKKKEKYYDSNLNSSAYFIIQFVFKHAAHMSESHFIFFNS